ncbi:MAG: T9SS type A sorting domain-containing protein [Sphingobacteriales bacterium]|nr:MAG: T9SS type A sorting domain-containing protein [Sphingobacteriales bacterium]
MRIDSVTLITDGAGTYTIGLRNTLSTLPGSMVMDSVTVSVPAAGTHRVYLGLEVPTPGTGYTLGLLSSTVGSGGLFRNTAGATFPYVNPGVISITGAAFGTDPFTSPRFYNFYNWSVSASACESPRVAVVATVNTAPSAAFTFTNTGTTYSFNATTTAGATYSWTFSGGTVTGGNTATPSVTFANSGTYTATLTTSTGGCSATTSQVIVITSREAELSALVGVYPNPSSGQFNIELNGGISIEKIEVYNALGQVVQQHGVNGQQIQLNLANSADGVYTVRLTGNNVLVVKQLMLQK